MAKKTKQPPAQQAKNEPLAKSNFANLSSETIALICIIAAGFILRLIYLYEVKDLAIFAKPFSDAKIYLEAANKIAATGSWAGSAPFFMAPAYPYFLSLFVMVTDNPVPLILFVQVFISTFTIYILYRAGVNLGNKRAGIIAAAFASFSVVFIFYASSLLSETLQIFLVSVLLFVLSYSFNGNVVRRYFLAGIILGAAAVFRANILLFLPVVLFFLWRTFRTDDVLKPLLKKTAILFTVGVLLPVLPVTLHNLAHSGEFVLLTTNGGINFYLGNNAEARGVFETPKEFDYDSDMSGKHYASRMTGSELTASGASSYWMWRGLEFVGTNPIQAAGLFGTKLFLFFAIEENSQSTMMNYGYFAENFSDILKLPLFTFFITAVFAFIGMILLRDRKKEFGIYYLLAASLVIGTILFFVNGRFRAPALPVFILFASFGVYRLFELISEKKFRVLLYPGIFTAVYVFSAFFLFPKFTFLPSDIYVHLGNTLFEQLDYGHALETYQEALKMDGNDVRTYVRIGNTYSAMDDYPEAINWYNRAIEKNPNYPLTLFNFGVMYYRTGNYLQAETQFLNALKLDPFFVDAHKNLGLMYFDLGNYAKAIPHMQAVLQYSDDDMLKETVQQDLTKIENIVNGRRNQTQPNE